MQVLDPPPPTDDPKDAPLAVPATDDSEALIREARRRTRIRRAQMLGGVFVCIGLLAILGFGGGMFGGGLHAANGGPALTPPLDGTVKTTGQPTVTEITTTYHRRDRVGFCKSVPPRFLSGIALRARSRRWSSPVERAVYLLPPMYKFDVIVLGFATPGGGHRLGMWSGTAWKGETHLQSMNAFAAKLTRWPSMPTHEMRSIQRMYGFTGAGRWQNQAAICATEFGG